MTALVSALRWDGMRADFAVAGKDLREVDPMADYSVALKEHDSAACLEMQTAASRVAHLAVPTDRPSVCSKVALSGEKTVDKMVAVTVAAMDGKKEHLWVVG